MSNFLTDIRFLKGVGEKRAQHLYSLGIDTIGALLRYFPRGYEDFSNQKQIFDCLNDEKVCVKARIITPITEHKIRSNMTLFKFKISDGTAHAQVTIFNNKYLAARLHEGSEYLFAGKMQMGKFSFEMSSPEIREVGDCGILPVYPASKNMTSSAIQKLVKTALQNCEIEDVLPESIRRAYKLCDLRDAIHNIHFPKSEQALASAKRHLVFEELFVLRTGLMLLKNKRKITSQFVLTNDYTKDYINSLPFDMTAAQKRVIADCAHDMSSGKIMNRLVQGDVGCGKTAVAAALMYHTAKSGFQAAIMAPTEILAEQHYKNLSESLKDSGLKCVLVTGSLKKSQRQAAKDMLSSGEAQIAVGTHALISEDIEFKNLALVITDEQHRFGVSQRASLSSKGIHPHTLVMSATPIPRTLGLIIYGDLDISVIDEYPRGRQQIDNYCVSSKKRLNVFEFIKKHLNEGRQGYIVCPMVEENEETNLKSAEQYFAEIKDGAFKDYSVGLLHGKMKPKEKDAVMRAFKDGEIQLLVCTTVIEVGIDVPNSAVMVIENAERFGLSQLHQLRGRIGRGKYKSSCVFISDYRTGITAERLKVIKESTDGFKIADEDLRLRGPGDFLGSRQHGLPSLKIADLYADNDMLRLASMAAANLLENDPKLKKPENENLRKEIVSMYRRLNEN
ncbi:MAG: ATP-dependent DNA helicase RecG [Clostridia bacterium]|nr:ATP-dependent DNA helicase RecG [Clostridia bacterium]